MYNLLVMSGVKNIERYIEYKTLKLDRKIEIVYFFIMIANTLLIIFRWK